jgi:hypothetical protein
MNNRYISSALVLMFAVGLLAVTVGLQNALAATARDFSPGQLERFPNSQGASGNAPGRSPGDPVIFAPGHAKNLEGGGGGQGP